MSGYREAFEHYHAEAAAVGRDVMEEEPCYLVVDGIDTWTHVAREAWSALAQVATCSARPDYATVVALHAKVAEWDEAGADTITDDDEGMDYAVIACNHPKCMPADRVLELAADAGELPPAPVEWFTGNLALDAERARAEAATRHDLAMAAVVAGFGGDVDPDDLEDWRAFAAVLEARAMYEEAEAA